MNILARSWKYSLIVVGIAILVLLVMDFNSRMSELRRLSTEKDRTSTTVTALAATRVYLETEVAYATSEPAVAEWALSQKMAQPGDNLVIPVPPYGSTPVPTPVPVVTPVVIQNWQIWLSLFADQSISTNLK
jgi:hypothetical protein